MAERQHCLWESPDGNAAVYIAFEAIDAINAAIQQASVAAPVRGAEIGGLLLGKAENRTRLTVWIDQVELLPCRYPRGPPFHLDPEDKPDLSRPGIVGFFRSHTRKELFLSADDLALFSQDFPAPENVFLLVKPFTTRPNLAGFFYWKDGRIDGAASPREFPFHRRELGGGDPRSTAVAPSTFEPESDLPDPASNPERAKPILMWAMLAFLAFVTAGSVAYLLFERTRPMERTKPIAAAESKSDPAFGLTVSEGQREITVRWDRHSRQLGSAIRAIVEIQEGSFQKSVPLDRDQLRTGSIVYSRPVAVSDTVSFRMRVFFEQNPPVSESVQLVSNLPLLPPAPLPHFNPEKTAPAETAKVAPAKPEVAPKPAASIRIEPPLPVQTETSRPETPNGEAAPALARPAPRRIP